MTDQPTNPTEHTAADGTRLVAIDAAYTSCACCWYWGGKEKCPSNCMPEQRTDGRMINWRKVAQDGAGK